MNHTDHRRERRLHAVRRALRETHGITTFEVWTSRDRICGAATLTDDGCAGLNDVMCEFNMSFGAPAPRTRRACRLTDRGDITFAEINPWSPPDRAPLTARFKAVLASFTQLRGRWTLPTVTRSTDSTQTPEPDPHLASDGGTKQGITHADDTPTDTDTSDDTEAVKTDHDAEPHPQTDHWDQPVEHFDDPACGAGEQCKCQLCGERFEVAMVAATAQNSPNWEEFYECQQCGARGSFRVDETQPSREAQRTWTGRMAYPELDR